MKSLFLSLCTNPEATVLSIDYDRRYVLVYNSKFSANRILRNSLDAGAFTFRW